MVKRIIYAVIMAMVCQTSWAQLCQGSLGDPIVNITFGSGSNPGSPLPAAATGYQYLAVDCPNDGQYAVRNRTENCYQTWHTLNGDHTGDPGGYFMLVNATFQPSAFYLDTVDLYCSNTVYEFAAWAMNMMRFATCAGNPTILPNLTFRIERTDGTLIQDYDTGDIPIVSTPTWNQYGFFFTAPPGENRVVLRILNNAPGGCGNDIAIDDITFRPCGPQVSSSVNGASSFNYCHGDPLQLNFTSAISSGFNNPLLQWQSSSDNGVSWNDIPGANNANLVISLDEFTPPGAWLYRQTISQGENAGISVCRVNSEVLIVNVYESPAISLTTNSPVCEGGTIELTATGEASWQWTGPNGFTGNSSSIFLSQVGMAQAGMYYATAFSEEGCMNVDSIEIIVNPSPVAFASPAESVICAGEEVQLYASGGDAYAWHPGDGLSASGIPDPIAAPLDTIEYMLVVSNNFSCTDTSFVKINVNAFPIANAGPDREILEGRSIMLDGTANGTSIDVKWSPDFAIDDVRALHPVVNPNMDTSYILTATSLVGCGSWSDTVRVEVYKSIFVPSAFSPNNDGLNDVWRIPALGIFPSHEVLVFNRHGQLIFSTNNNLPWDGTFRGKPQPPGVYVYVVRVKNENISLKGWLMLVR